MLKGLILKPDEVQLNEKGLCLEQGGAVSLSDTAALGDRIQK